MKRTEFKILTRLLFAGIFFTVIFSSCLKMDDTDVPTRESEKVELNKYLSNLISAGNNVDTTNTGIYYITMEKGTGAFPKNGDTLTVGYAGYLINGYLFDASAWHNQIDSTFTFVLGNPAMIKGWDDGMKVINKNAKVQLIVPSDFAYGSSGAGVIPPFNTIVFVIKMKEIKPSK
jgi:FKBP-type peptidyl-prolyl cis-trans isomerase